MKYCPSCGTKTLHETDEHYDDSGISHVCYTCGHNVGISEFDEIEHTVKEKPPICKFEPLYSYEEMMIGRFYKQMIEQSLSAPIFFRHLPKDVNKNDKIVFRKTTPFKAEKG